MTRVTVFQYLRGLASQGLRRFTLSPFLLQTSISDDGE